MARGSSILLIDDDPEASEIFQLLLTREGFCVDVASDAASGLACFESKTHQCVVSDLNMKGLTGFDVADTLNRHPRRPVLIALSGEVGPGVEAKVRSAGFDHHLAKPIDWPELQAVLSALPLGGDE